MNQILSLENVQVILDIIWSKINFEPLHQCNAGISSSSGASSNDSAGTLAGADTSGTTGTGTSYFELREI